MPLKKPSQLFESKVVEEENSSPARKYLNDTYKRFQGSLSKIEELQGRVEEIYTQYPKTFEILTNELDNRITKDDLDNTMFTHLTVVDENFKAIQEQVKGVNKKDLKEFRNSVSELTYIVENLIDVELPQYRKRVTKDGIRVSEKLSESENKVTEQLNKFSDFIKNKFDKFDTDFKLTKEDVLKTSETYKKLHLVVENKYLEASKKLEEYTNILEDFNDRVNEFTSNIDEYEDSIAIEKDSIIELKDVVKNLIDVELPQYKNRVTGAEVKFSDKLSVSENKISDKLSVTESRVTEELNKFSSFLEEKIGQFDKEFAETKEDVLKTSETYQKLYKVAKDKYTEENKKIEEYSNILEEFNSRVNDFTDEFRDKISDSETRWSNYEKYIGNEKNSIVENFNELKKEIKSNVDDIKVDVVVNEKHIGKIEGYIQDNKKDLVDLKENVIKDLSNILNGDIQTNIKRLENKINSIQEKYDAIKPEEVMKDLKEGLLNNPSDVDNSDPLTPLDKNFVTTKQLQDHYRLFVSRIQQQLATLGGGGAVNIRELDDVDLTTARVDGKYLKYNSTTDKWEGADASGGGIAGISTTGTSFFNNLNLSGISTIGFIRINHTTNQIDTSAGNLILDSHGGTLEVNDILDVSGNITGTGDLTLTDTTADSAAGPEFKLFRNSASPADADYIGQIKFAGESDTGVERNYAKITGKILDASNGTEDGILEFAHIKAGSQTITGRWRSDSLQLLNGTNFSVAGNSDFTGDVTMAGDVDIAGELAAPSVASSVNGIRKITTSTSAPSGGSDGDVWFKYTA